MFDSVDVNCVCNSKHNTTLAINGDSFTPACQASSSQAPSSLPWAPLAHGAASVSPVHSRRDPFSVDYGLWSFVDNDYNIVCTVTNLAVNIDLSLWTPLLTEEARRQAALTRISPSYSTRSSQHTTRIVPRLKPGKGECANGAVRAPHVPVTLGTLQPPKVTVLEPRRPLV